jgi:hypothetical protein
MAKEIKRKQGQQPKYTFKTKVSSLRHPDIDIVNLEVEKQLISLKKKYLKKYGNKN